MFILSALCQQTQWASDRAYFLQTATTQPNPRKKEKKTIRDELKEISGFVYKLCARELFPWHYKLCTRELFPCQFKSSCDLLTLTCNMKVSHGHISIGLHYWLRSPRNSQNRKFISPSCFSHSQTGEIKQCTNVHQIQSKRLIHSLPVLATDQTSLHSDDLLWLFSSIRISNRPYVLTIITNVLRE